MQIQDPRAELARRNRILAALPLARRSRADRRRRRLGEKLPGPIKAPMRIPQHSRVVLHSIQSRKTRKITKIRAWKTQKKSISRSGERDRLQEELHWRTGGVGDQRIGAICWWKRNRGSCLSTGAGGELKQQIAASVAQLHSFLYLLWF